MKQALHIQVIEERLRIESAERKEAMQKLACELYDNRLLAEYAIAKLDRVMKHLGVKEVKHPACTTIEADE